MSNAHKYKFDTDGFHLIASVEVMPIKTTIGYSALLAQATDIIDGFMIGL